MSNLPEIDYDGRRFTRSDVTNAPIAVYSQSGKILTGIFAGGEVPSGALTGMVAEGSVIHFGYSMVNAEGEVIVGRCISYPFIDGAGLINLEEHWERFTPMASHGISYLRELKG